MNEALAISSMSVMLVCLVNFHRKLFIPLEEPVKYLKLALRRMSRYWQYAACSLLTRSHQNLDKLLVAFVMPEATWVVSMVGYCANLPAMAYEMTTLRSEEHTSELQSLMRI